MCQSHAGKEVGSGRRPARSKGVAADSWSGLPRPMDHEAFMLRVSKRPTCRLKLSSKAFRNRILTRAFPAVRLAPVLASLSGSSLLATGPSVQALDFLGRAM